jgi:hypothetical protein
MNPLNAYGWFVLLHLVIAAMGTYAFARVLGARPAAAWIGGLAAFCALHWIHWSLHLQHLTGMAWMPAALAATHNAIVNPRPRSAGILGLIFGLWWLGGGVQYSYFGTVALVTYACVLLVVRGLRRRDALRSLSSLIGGLAAGSLLAMPVLLPTIWIGNKILREHEPVAAMAATHLPLADLLLALIPDARGSVTAGVTFRPYPNGLLGLDTPYVGVVALVLAATAAFATDKRRTGPLVLGGVAVLILGFCSFPHATLHALLPGYDRFRVSSRWLSVLPALVLPLAALGANSLLGGERRARYVVLASSAVAAIGVAVFTVYTLWNPDAPKWYFAVQAIAALLPLAAAALAAVVAERRTQLAVALLAAGVLVEASFHTRPWYPAVPKAVAYPPVALAEVARKRGGRIIRIQREPTQLGPFVPDVPLVYGVADSEGQAVFFPAAYDRYLRLIDDYGDYALATNTAPPLRDPGMVTSPLVRLLDVRTVIAASDASVPHGAKLLAGGSVRTYGATSYGAAQVVSDGVPATEDAMWRNLGRRTWDPRASAYVAGLPRPVHGGQGRAVLESRTSTGERWSVDAPKGGMLRISGNYFDGWTAREDSRRVPVYRADGVFRAVPLSPGHHEVVLSYQNPSELRGRWLGLAGFVVIVLLIAPIWRDSRSIA